MELANSINHSEWLERNAGIMFLYREWIEAFHRETVQNQDNSVGKYHVKTSQSTRWNIDPQTQKEGEWINW